MLSSLTRVHEFRAGAGLTAENETFDRMCADAVVGARIVRFWRQEPCLVVPAAWKNQSGFALACHSAEQLGFPVVLRNTGGATVFHGAGCLCVSHFQLFNSERAEIASCYQRLSGAISNAIELPEGKRAAIDWAPQAPCDGRYNVVIDSRKLAGLAMRQRRLREGKVCVLSHAVVWTHGDISTAISAINQFERHLGREGRFDPAGCITLAEAQNGLERPAPLAVFIARVVQGLDIRRQSAWITPPSTTS